MFGNLLDSFIDLPELELLEMEPIHESVEYILEVFRIVRVLYEDWVIYYEVDANNNVISEEYTLRLVFDLHEWVDAIVYVFSEYIEDPDSIYDELPVVVVNLTIEYSATYENINNATVSMPILTPENSVDIMSVLP